MSVDAFASFLDAAKHRCRLNAARKLETSAAEAHTAAWKELFEVDASLKRVQPHMTGKLKHVSHGCLSLLLEWFQCVHNGVKDSTHMFQKETTDPENPYF